MGFPSGVQQPASLERARSRRQRLDRVERGLDRVVGVQAGLVEAVDRLERRTTAPPAGLPSSAPPALGRRPARVHRGMRLAVQVLGVLLAGLAVAMVFSSGQSLHPSVGMPPALADPTTTATLEITPPTTVAGGQAGGMVGGRATTVGGGGPRRGATRPAAVAPGAAAAPPGPTTTTLPAVTSTTLPALPETTLLAVPPTTLCRNPKHCDHDD